MKNLQNIEKLTNQLARIAAGCARDWFSGNEVCQADFIAAAHLAGFGVLGRGHFAVVVTHKEAEGLAIKVGLKKEDSGAAYAAYCRQNQHDPHIPQVYHIKRHTVCYTVVLEKLYSLPKVVCKHMWEEGLTKEQTTMRDQFLVANSLLSRFPIIPKYKPEGDETKTIQKTAKAIQKFFAGVGSFDLHRHNAMMREDGTIVITDPVSFSAYGASPWDALNEEPDYEIRAKEAEERFQKMASSAVRRINAEIRRKHKDARINIAADRAIAKRDLGIKYLQNLAAVRYGADVKPENPNAC